MLDDLQVYFSEFFDQLLLLRLEFGGPSVLLGALPLLELGLGESRAFESFFRLPIFFVQQRLVVRQLLLELL